MYIGIIYVYVCVKTVSVFGMSLFYRFCIFQDVLLVSLSLSLYIYIYTYLSILLHRSSTLLNLER